MKTHHSKQSAELADQLERLRQEKREMERESLKQKAELKGKIPEPCVIVNTVNNWSISHFLAKHDFVCPLLIRPPYASRFIWKNY